MKKKTNYNLNEEELKAILRLVEAQRELSYHLQKYKEALELRVKELNLIITKAQEVQRLKHNFHYDPVLNNLTEEERKQINILLQSKHIRV